MVWNKDVEILSIKRILKKPHYDFKKYSYSEQKELFMLYNEGLIKGRYKNKVKYKVDDNIKTAEYIYIKNEKLDTKVKRIRENIVSKENEAIKRTDLRFKNNQIAKKSTKSQKNRGFYFTSIKINIIVRYRFETPFHFPTKNKTNSITRARNLTEKQILNSILYDEDMEQFKMWYKRGLTDKNVHIFGGWTYKRVFSRTGSFNGDTLYLDYYKREFLGSSNSKITNFLKEYQEENNKSIKIL